MVSVKKRKLREGALEESAWLKATPAERLEAVEVINRLREPEYAQQAFPRVYKITRKARR